MKKILILIITLICTVAVFSQEKKEYKVINDNLVEVRIYNDGDLTQKGVMRNVGDKWVNDGLWTQYNKKGGVDLKVKYSKGVKLWVTKQYEDYVVTIEKKKG
jgi:antitoxin component YwqK of YwqJK toxin-antitoxin module